MPLAWHRESPAVWDADKQRIIGGAPAGIFALTGGSETVLPGDWWRVEDDGAVVGYGWMDYSWGDAEVLLAVDPARQSSGVGTFILDRLDDEAAARGLNYLYNVVPPAHQDKPTLKRWLLQRGFTGSLEGTLFKRAVHPRRADREANSGN
jgi:N-acetylglutamate synthase-like GNAT family acetyltransferase